MRPQSYSAHARKIAQERGLVTSISALARQDLSTEESNRLLDVIKAEFKTWAKAESRELHPDLVGEDPVKLERFYAIREVLDALKDLYFKEMPMQLPLAPRRSSTMSYTSTSTSNSTYSYNSSPFRRAR